MNSRYIAICAGLILAALIATAALFPHLPPQVPLHWNIHGRLDAYGPRWTVFLWPGITAAVLLLLAVLPWLSPRHFELETFRSTYHYLMFVVVAELTYINGLILWAALSANAGIVRALIAGVCLQFVLIGNVMGKIRRNFFVGIRTPWTLANERVWHATHRFAAKIMVATGAAAFFAALAGSPFWLSLGLLLLGALSPIVYSLLCYKGLQCRGHLEV